MLTSLYVLRCKIKITFNIMTSDKNISKYIILKKHRLVLYVIRDMLCC